MSGRASGRRVATWNFSALESKQTVRLFAVLGCTIVWLVGAESARAESCEVPPLRFRGGEYALRAEAVRVSRGPEVGTAQVPDLTGEGCDPHYGPAAARSIRGVSPLIVIGLAGGGVWVAGERCSFRSGRAVARCLQRPLRFRGRTFHLVRAPPLRPGHGLGRGWIGNARIRVAEFPGVDARYVVGLVGRPGVRYFADGVCRGSWSSGLAECLQAPHVMALQPLPGSGRSWIAPAALSALVVAILAAAALAVRRHW